ncbi:MAG: phosphopyruvate hydratase [Chloroflexota bacterium]
MDSIEKVSAREILDSRGNPTVEVSVELADGSLGWAAVPSGASTGGFEALELRDGDPKRFGGKGVLRAIAHVQEIIAPAIMNMSALAQEEVDGRLIELDGTDNKSRLGANALLGVSLAVAHAAADFLGLPLYRYLGGVGVNVLPVPLMNILNGGLHAPGSADIQEFMVVPVKEDFSSSLRAGVEIYHALKQVLLKRGLAVQVGDEGGFAPQLVSNRQGVEFILEAIIAAGYHPGQDCFIALDVAANELYREGSYVFSKEGHVLSARQVVDYYEELVRDYPIISIEDGLAEEDWEGWQLMTGRLSKKVLIVGDDLYATNGQRLARGIATKASTAILIKPNQIGTLSETIACLRQAHRAGLRAIISHRSGETEDTTIADLAVGLSSGLIKTGAPCRSERVAKYNRLLRIEAELGLSARFAGRAIFNKVG